jgi:hypothetical protein
MEYAMNIFQILALLRSLLPAIQVVAEAFRFGVEKHGADTWKSTDPNDHVMKAFNAISQWSSSNRYSALADAALRLLFALCLTAASQKYVPKVKPEVEEKVEETGQETRPT